MATFSTAQRAGLKFTTVTDQGRYRTAYTEYFQADFERSDHWIFLPERTVHSTRVHDHAQEHLMIWYADRPEYVVIRTDPPPARAEPATPEPATGPPDLIITTSTIDTGERANFFGRQTRHLITEETRRWVGAERRGSDTNTTLDGWYVDTEILPAARQCSVMCVLVVGNREPITEIHHTGPTPSALAMLCRQTSLMPLPDGSLHVMDETVSHVVEWVEGPLPDELFFPPAGYRQIEELTR